MLYFKNVELADKYHVSEGSVRNWIKEAQQGKLSIDLYDKGGRPFVANTTSNLALIEKMITNRKKYRTNKSQRSLVPQPEFYELYSRDQIYDMISNLEKTREIERKYNYFDGGADAWDAYANRLAAEETANLVNSTIKLVQKNLNYIDNILGDFDKVNIVDIGPGNGLPVKDMIEHLLKQGKLNRYIAVDISRPMLSILERNIKEWFGDTVNYEGFEADINYDRFISRLSADYLNDSSNKTVNLVLMLGGTLCNERDLDGPLKIIHDSMGVNDILMHTQKLDTEDTRKFFDFKVGPVNSEPPPMHKIVLDLLNFDKSMYQLETGFDTERCERFEKIYLNTSLSITFNFDGHRKVIHFNKGESILIWRYKHQTMYDVIEQFTKNHLYVLHMSQTFDEEYILTVSKSK
jgi:uncharacterized SAM-dependent methyltransferase